MRWGRLSASLKSGVPHLGQKRRRMVLPLSAVLRYSPRSPVILKLSVLKIVLMEALPDDRYYQSLHQQARVATGSSSDWKRTAPQKHRPVTGFAIPTLLPRAADHLGCRPRRQLDLARSAARRGKRPRRRFLP
jgi:hypothetical protein